MNQKQAIVSHILTNGSITQLEATLAGLGTRLSERIRELEADGYVFDKKSERNNSNPTLRVVRYTRYFLLSQPTSPTHE